MRALYQADGMQRPKTRRAISDIYPRLLRAATTGAYENRAQPPPRSRRRTRDRAGQGLATGGETGVSLKRRRGRRAEQVRIESGSSTTIGTRRPAAIATPASEAVCAANRRPVMLVF